MKTLRTLPIWLLSLALLMVPVQLLAQDNQAPPPPPPQDQAPPPPQDQQAEPENAPPQQAAPAESPEQLQQLVAPIALYPDSLVAQILNASTFPTQIVEAERWLQQNSGLSGEQLAQAVDAQAWDPSVKALIQFPSVLENMDKNLSWTSSLGDAYYNQQQDVMDAIQVMRQRARQAGNLKNTPQEVVSDQGGQIAIQPANPSVVYVPIYDPWYAYGPPIAVWPGFVYTSWWVPRPFFGFSIGFPIGFWGHFGWGWPAWGLNWHARNVWFHGAPYFSRGPAFFDRRGYYRAGVGPGFRGGAGFRAQPGFRGQPGRVAESPRGGFRPGPAARPVPNVGRGFGAPQGQRGVRSGAFSGFQHGGNTRSFSSRGRSSFSGGGSRGGGSHGGGGRRK
jgi:uncharacterized membrane protein YgcG